MEVDLISIRDLELCGVYESGILLTEKGVVSIYNSAKTKAGKEFIDNYFRKPHKSIKKIIENQKILSYFVNNFSRWKDFWETLNYYEFDGLNRYLDSNILSFYSKNFFRMTYKSYIVKIFYEQILDEIISGIEAVASLVKRIISIKSLIDSDKTASSLFLSHLKKINRFLELEVVKDLMVFDRYKYNARKIIKLDYYLRNQFISEIKGVFEIIVEIDGRIGLASAFIDNKLCMPEFVDVFPYIEGVGIYHPLVKNPVRNSVCLSKEKNFMFLTGPNMGGKTTFLKSLGICVYLAHLGFGVPAEKFKLSFFDNLTTVISTDENILKGYSCFMGEVQRVKQIAKKVSSGKNCLILMDEIFKGTNFVDAFETTKSVILKMIKCKTSIFILSTHLFEIAESLKEYDDIIFKCFEAILDEKGIKYDYVLRDGISESRLGMKIIKLEGILEAFDGGCGEA